MDQAPYSGGEQQAPGTDSTKGAVNAKSPSETGRKCSSQGNVLVCPISRARGPGRRNTEAGSQIPQTHESDRTLPIEARRRRVGRKDVAALERRRTRCRKHDDVEPIH